MENPVSWLTSGFARGLAATLALSFFAACGGSKGLSDAERRRAEFCKPVLASHQFEETPFVGSDSKVLSFQTIRATVNTACSSCHQVPANTGGFTYADSWGPKEISINGSSQLYPGFFDLAEKMRDAIFHPDEEKKKMPPKERRLKNPEAFLEIGRQLDLWILSGKPNGTFEAGKIPEERKGKFRPVKPVQTSDLGDCIPTAKAIGQDYDADKYFETAKELPKYLTDTDLFTLDPYQLATHGTVAYNVEYPLWADNAEKGRWIHIPMILENGKLKKQAVNYNPVIRQFEIPENTRFYKSFYRAVTLPNKKVRMRRIETRVIVARTPYEKSLIGTYQWDETEQVATLVEAPYRDGTPFKDVIFDVVVDEAKNKTRPYGIPGRQRCLDCHMGSEMNNQILGFTPLQINKREFGGGGRTDYPASSDLDQVQRFIDYGMLKGISSARELPILEESGDSPAANIHELRANGYTTGNCYHCHNEKGLAFTKENGVQLELGPGKLFRFDTNRMSTQITGRKLVHQQGELESSHIWHKVFDPPAQQGMFSQMPMHTAGTPDCKALTLLGKFIRSKESEEAANIWEPVCKKENPIFWIDMDFTWPISETYTPRRADWASQDGMSQRYRDLTLTPSLAQTIRDEYAVGYWSRNPKCKFPDVPTMPQEKLRPWMTKKDGTPKRPFGEVYYATPGNYFFRSTCIKCHGPRADGDSSLAKGILNWSGGSVRVANLIDGMFGKNTENMKTFDLNGKNYAGNYLIWMAMEGTRVRFPPELSMFVGKHGGQMLNGVRDRCLAQISTEKASTPVLVEYEVYNKVCFMENLAKGHPDLEFDGRTNKPKYPDRVEAWLDRAAWNAGWAIFEYLREAGQGVWPPGGDECEKKYPVGAAQETVNQSNQKTEETTTQPKENL